MIEMRRLSNLYPTVRKHLTRKTEFTVYKTIFRLMLTYESESWMLPEQTKSILQAAAMRYLRGISEEFPKIKKSKIFC